MRKMCIAHTQHAQHPIADMYSHRQHGPNTSYLYCRWLNFRRGGSPQSPEIYWRDDNFDRNKYKNSFCAYWYTSGLLDFAPYANYAPCPFSHIQYYKRNEGWEGRPQTWIKNPARIRTARRGLSSSFLAGDSPKTPLRVGLWLPFHCISQVYDKSFMFLSTYQNSFRASYILFISFDTMWVPWGINA